jgi:hypothetical protein
MWTLVAIVSGFLAGLGICTYGFWNWKQGYTTALRDMRGAMRRHLDLVQTDTDESQPN